MKRILDATLQTDDWVKKLVGMQIVVEGLALYSFREMRNLTQEPLLKDLLTYVARDESRHHAYGVQYVSRCVPCLSAAELKELEDFALEAARTRRWVEYAAVRDPERLALEPRAPLARARALIAARVGGVRLIDNLERSEDGRP